MKYINFREVKNYKVAECPAIGCDVTKIIRLPRDQLLVLFLCTAPMLSMSQSVTRYNNYFVSVSTGKTLHKCV